MRPLACGVLAQMNRPGFAGGSNSKEDGAMTSPTTDKFSPEVRDRAVRMVLEHEGEHASRWAAMVSIAEKIGCSPHTLREWVQKAGRDTSRWPGVASDVAAKLKALERENRELRQANEILRKASAYFAQAELDRRFRP
jgi:transposase-like protein